ncbi:inhibin alpha chain [Paramormyrops kingsleyae]|uniref:Inhibin alpha chain n=1 Tax=Paramormyrops kingsleyae TaxID=1676925 RepID=A0A3B3THD7_9TELE|nr:inhibin alpha chain [Paramormyrops kingsleyae]
MRSRWLDLLIVFLASLALWGSTWTRACQGEGVPQSEVLDWFKRRVLEGLGLNQAPVPLVQQPPASGRASRVGRAAQVERRRSHQETSQVILFPSSDSTCAHDEDLPLQEAFSHFTYYFQPSGHSQETVITSAHFWFYAGEGALRSNTSAPLYILTANQELIHVAEGPTKLADDGWVTYHVGRHISPAMAEGPFVIQVRCPSCGCYADASKTPFLHLNTRSRGSDRSRRALIPWSPSSIELLQRPPEERPDYDDCHREELNISFADLGWENWIVHPQVFTFYYCHGNCSSWNRMTTLLGIKQCCAPLPGTMKSLRFRTTSDGGYSFKYETLPNIIAEDCTCI